MLKLEGTKRKRQYIQLHIVLCLFQVVSSLLLPPTLHGPLNLHTSRSYKIHISSKTFYN